MIQNIIYLVKNSYRILFTKKLNYSDYLKPDNSKIKIFGIVLIKNEDIFIEKVITNISEFCDEILILDNHSTDNTGNIVQSICRKYDHINVLKWDDPNNSGIVLNHLIGKKCWVFGVDGDEIYDPKGLHIIKQKILNEEYNEFWAIKGQFMHCNKIENKICSGWLDARLGDKLYNFSLLDYWNQSQRLHGKMKLRNNMEAKTFHLAIDQGGEYSWEDCPLRCIHVCFLRRSSKDPSNIGPRQHPLAKPNYKEIQYIGTNKVSKYVPFI